MSKWEEVYLDEINYFIDTYIDDVFEDDEDKEVLKNITDEDKRIVVDELMNDSWLNEQINNTIEFAINKRFGVDN